MRKIDRRPAPDRRPKRSRRVVPGAPALLAAALLATAGPAAALTLDVPGQSERLAVSYRCSDGRDRAVAYVGIGPNSLAILPVEGETRIFVATLAASGVRYASGPFVWWEKGGKATLTDETAPNAPGIACDEVGREG